MMLRACSRLAAEGALPSAVWAVRVMVVPPLRSKPNRGDQEWVNAISPYIAAMTTRKMMRVLPGWGLCWVLATYRSPWSVIRRRRL